MPNINLCEVVDNEQLLADTFALTVICKELALEARAGQFVHIECGESCLLRRPVSICSVRGDALEFVFEVKGEGTRWLSAREPGHMLDILGPLGNGFYLPDGDIIVIGGGIGSPPMLFASESATGNVTAVLGFRNENRIILKEEFASVCDEVYITTDDGSFGILGPATVPLVDLLERGGYEAVLACGPRAMLSAIAVLCKLYSIPCQVSLEERMGCGVGACLVCACAMANDGVGRMGRVCKDGPVFDVEEIVW